MRARIVRANDIDTKLRFINNVVGQWIRNGGLGRLDSDADVVAELAASGKESVQAEKLYWEGMMVKDQARKIERVTVGRLGGDVRESEKVVAAVK